MLVNGIWKENWQPVQQADDDGRFIRQTSSFRNWVTADGSAGVTGAGGFRAEPGRYHLYVAYICPWASRALMARQLKGLAELVSVSVVNPVLTDQGWAFGGFAGSDEDTLNGARYMHELYTRADPTFSGRATVPVLWDKQTATIVNNESADIVRMFNSAFRDYVNDGPDLYPAALATEIDALNTYLYTELNNGVYQAGFATTQLAYKEAYGRVFAALDAMESRLADGRRYLFGEVFTESDIRLFVTLVRFDAAYYSLFKCNRNLLREMPNLHRYLHRVLAFDDVKATVNLAHIKAGYYSIRALNPTGIVPEGPGECVLPITSHGCHSVPDKY
ncbi:glutathione S-transferase family protein [Microbulbifer pacificus]|uniref:glutathione S-transferase family protein n=1 Tax=Microbulbifer pacificus TaxID=407164 RepID=UPI000CF54C8C|nr:glutathione S-transferase family protein [Microbulbifer pacificus]